MMDTEQELINVALAIGGAGGAVADAVKKAIFHGHGVDWAILATLAEALRINAATLALLAERETEHAQGLSNVTLGPDFALLLGDRLPGDVAETCAMCEEVV